MQFNFTEMWQHMGLPALLVAIVLLTMGLASLTVFVERVITLARSRAASRAFAAKVSEAMQGGNFELIVQEAANFERGHLARVVRTGLQTYGHAEKTAEVSGLTPLEQTQRHMERYMEQVSADLRRGLSLLAS